MKCKNCPSVTKYGARLQTWRDLQLCPWCAHDKYPDKYRAPMGRKKPSRKFGEEKKTESVGRYAN